MPHFIIEHGNALASPEARRDAMAIAAQAGSACGFIDPKDIKVRLRDYQDFMHLDGCTSFIHVTVRLLAGRTPGMKERLSIALRERLADRFVGVDSISVEVCDMEPVSYKKRLLVRDQS